MSWDGAQIRLRAKSPIAAMLKQNRLDPTLGFFWAVVFVHIIFWTLLASKTQPNVPAETLDLLSSGRQLAWGYPSQPPMGVWVASIAGSIAAPRIWPLYLMAQICGVISVWSAWVLARKFLHPWTALCAAIVLLGGYSCTIAASEFSSTHLASAFWSLSILTFHEALTEERRRYWAATGLLMACGFLTSYATLLLLATMFMFTLWDDRARRCWDSSWPFLAGLIMFAAMMPHLLWLGQNDFSTIQNKLATATNVVHHLEQPLAYLGTQLLCLIPVLVLLTPLVAWFSFEEPATSQDEPRDFARQYLLWMTCLPPVIIFGLSLFAGPSSIIFAGVTNWTYLGLALLLWGHLSETRLAWRRSLIRIGTAVGVFAAALIAINLMLPQLSRQAFNTHFPGKELAREVESAWKSSGYSGPVPVIAGPPKLVRNAVWNSQSSGKIAVYEDVSGNPKAGLNDFAFSQRGGVMLWDMSSESPVSYQDLAQRFGRVSMLQPVEMKWRGLADLPEIKVGMAIVHPSIAQVTKPASNLYANDKGVNENILPPGYPKAGIVPATSLQGGGVSSNQSSIPATYQFPALDSSKHTNPTQLGTTTPGANPTTPASSGSASQGFSGFPSYQSNSGASGTTGSSGLNSPALSQPTLSQPTQSLPAQSQSGVQAGSGFQGFNGFSGASTGATSGSSLNSAKPTTQANDLFAAPIQSQLPASGNMSNSTNSSTRGSTYPTSNFPSSNLSVPANGPTLNGTSSGNADPFSNFNSNSNSKPKPASAPQSTADEVLPDLSMPPTNSPSSPLNSPASQPKSGTSSLWDLSDSLSTGSSSKGSSSLGPSSNGTQLPAAGNSSFPTNFSGSSQLSLPESVGNSGALPLGGSLNTQNSKMNSTGATDLGLPAGYPSLPAAAKPASLAPATGSGAATGTNSGTRTNSLNGFSLPTDVLPPTLSVEPKPAATNLNSNLNSNSRAPEGLTEQ